jgi:hypothetical protein
LNRRDVIQCPSFVIRPPPFPVTDLLENIVKLLSRHETRCGLHHEPCNCGLSTSFSCEAINVMDRRDANHTVIISIAVSRKHVSVIGRIAIRPDHVEEKKINHSILPRERWCQSRREEGEYAEALPTVTLEKSTLTVHRLIRTREYLAKIN